MKHWSFQTQSTSALRLVSILALPVLATQTFAATNLYVSPSGRDSWSGMLPQPNAALTDGPKATLAGAQSAIALSRSRSVRAVLEYQVNVAPGVYTTLSSLALNGANNSSVTYRSTVPGAAIIDGSVKVTQWQAPAKAFLDRVSPKARPYLVCAGLPRFGVTSFGTLPLSHWTGNSNNVASTYNELYVNDVRQVIARWPNSGYAAVSSGGALNAFGADLSSSRVSKSDTNVNIYSFASGYDWAFQGLPAQVDTATGTVSVPSGMTFPAAAGGRFYLRNSLEELDRPGEYYVDRATGALLWYPTPGYLNADIRVSANVGPLLNLTNASNVSFDGFTFRNARGDAIVISGGSGNSLVNCLIKNTGGYGVRLVNTTNATIDSTTLREMGEGGVKMEGGGDMTTLTRGNNVVQNCVISGLGRLVPSYRPGILVAGVGNKAVGNDVSDGPHEGIQVTGALNTVESNHVHSVCRDTSDAGAIYAPGLATYRGNSIKGNLVEDVRNLINSGGIWGIYLDMRASGYLVRDNVVRRTDIGMILNGGRDNKIVNNVMVDCPTAFQFDDRSDQAYNGLEESLKAVPYQTGIWAATFPELATILSNSPTYPKNNVFARNGVLKSKRTLFLRSTKLSPASKETSLGLNEYGWKDVASAMSGLFLNEDGNDFVPVPGSQLANAGFQSVDAAAQAQTPVSANVIVRSNGARP